MVSEDLGPPALQGVAERTISATSSERQPAITQSNSTAALFGSSVRYMSRTHSFASRAPSTSSSGSPRRSQRAMRSTPLWLSRSEPVSSTGGSCRAGPPCWAITPQLGHPAARRIVSMPTTSSSPSGHRRHPESGQSQHRVIEFGTATHCQGFLQFSWSSNNHENGGAPVRAGGYL